MEEESGGLFGSGQELPAPGVWGGLTLEVPDP